MWICWYSSNFRVSPYAVVAVGRSAASEGTRGWPGDGPSIETSEWLHSWNFGLRIPFAFTPALSCCFALTVVYFPPNLAKMTSGRISWHFCRIYCLRKRWIYRTIGEQLRTCAKLQRIEYFSTNFADKFGLISSNKLILLTGKNRNRSKLFSNFTFVFLFLAQLFLIRRSQIRFVFFSRSPPQRMLLSGFDSPRFVFSESLIDENCGNGKKLISFLKPIHRLWNIRDWYLTPSHLFYDCANAQSSSHSQRKFWHKSAFVLSWKNLRNICQN